MGDEPQVTLAADQLTFDQEKEIDTASGNVEIRHDGRTLFADTISYSQKTDIVTATGNVTILEKTGEQIFGNRMEVTGDLKDGIVENIGVILQDRARIVGASAHRTVPSARCRATCVRRFHWGDSLLEEIRRPKPRLSRDSRPAALLFGAQVIKDHGSAKILMEF